MSVTKVTRKNKNEATKNVTDEKFMILFRLKFEMNQIPMDVGILFRCLEGKIFHFFFLKTGLDHVFARCGFYIRFSRAKS